MLKSLIPSILKGRKDTFVIHSYKGIGGKIPESFRTSPKTIKHRILLDNLPKLISGYGKTFRGYGSNYRAAIVVVCDLDDRNEKVFREELNALLDRCEHKPETRFCLAIEEGEAWFLGDMSAIKAAYPECNETIRQGYRQDSICGTWELLADMLYPGGSSKLLQSGYPAVGKEKCNWAERITPKMDVDHNESPSFCAFRDQVRELVSETGT